MRRKRSPAEVEDIEDEETPQASPDTDADKEEDKTENIEDEETAQAGAPGEGNWALLNLILMVLTVVAGLAMLALRFARKTGMAHLLGIVPAIVALVAFFVTEDMSLPMAMTDKWTLIMALIRRGAGGAARAVLELAGVKDIRAKSLRSNNKRNVVSATIQGLSELKQPEEVAKLRGKTVDQIRG